MPGSNGEQKEMQGFTCGNPVFGIWIGAEVQLPPVGRATLLAGLTAFHAFAFVATVCTVNADAAIGAIASARASTNFFTFIAHLPKIRKLAKTTQITRCPDKASMRYVAQFGGRAKRWA